MDNFGCVHGRFQPAHIEHMEYMLAAKRLCGHLIIGITQFDINLLINCKADPHRSKRFANPFDYTERCELIKIMMLENNINLLDFSFSPFPIDEPNELSRYIDKNVTCFTTIRDKWNSEKVDRLKKYGYKTNVLWDRSDQEKVSGTNIRTLASQGNEKWRDYVSTNVAKRLSQLCFEERMKSLL